MISGCQYMTLVVSIVGVYKLLNYYWCQYLTLWGVCCYILVLEVYIIENPMPNDTANEVGNEIDSYNRDWLTRVANDAVKTAVDELSVSEVTEAMQGLLQGTHLKIFTLSLQQFMQTNLSTNSPSVIIDFEKTKPAAYPPVEDYQEYYTTGQVKDNLNVAVGTVKNRIKRLEYVGAKFKDSDNFKLPAWQFHQGKPIAGVDDILHILGVNGVPAIRKFIMALARFDDKCIIDVLREGDLDLAKRMAKSLSEH